MATSVEYAQGPMATGLERVFLRVFSILILRRKNFPQKGKSKVNKFTFELLLRRT